MISNVLTVATLAGAAMAACPLSVQIVGADHHVAQVSVTNTGAEPITVFKGNTVLSEHATKDLVVTDASGKALPFEGAYVNYKRSGVSPDMFQTLQPGESVTASVNAARTYRLSGVKSANISALQGFKYVTGTTAPDSLKDLSFCEASSDSYTITPDQSKAAE